MFLILSYYITFITHLRTCFTFVYMVLWLYGELALMNLKHNCRFYVNTEDLQNLNIVIHIFGSNNHVFDSLNDNMFSQNMTHVTVALYTHVFFWVIYRPLYLLKQDLCFKLECEALTTGHLFITVSGIQSEKQLIVLPNFLHCYTTSKWKQSKQNQV